LFYLIDESSETINDSMFVVDMGPSSSQMGDRPSDRHGSAYELTFADGHGEAIRWQALASDWTYGDDPDWEKIKSMTTIPK
jgi:hypothetical protein